jgi:hypothetical protein
MAKLFGLDHTRFTVMLQERDWRDTADIRKLADWLDTRFAVPGTNLRFGFDSIIGLVPGIGDAITAALGAYILFRAHELGAPRWLMARMALNLAIDGFLGAVPLFGDAFDFAFKSHLRNVRLLLRWLEQKESRASPPLIEGSMRRKTA